MPTYERYIDFAARLGLPYYVIDEGWALTRGKNKPADVLHPADGIDVPALVGYAKARGVRLWLWADWKSLDGKMEAVLRQWQDWGVAGMKIDFIYRQDQDVVAFYHALLTNAARHRLLVNLHAAFVPRGLDRTYPNFLTQEGAMGNEYNRWSRDVTAGSNVRSAYSRATIGPMDYTPGGFRNVTPAKFTAGAIPPQVMTTRAHQLALFVIYRSPLTVLADAPVAYHNSSGGWAAGVDFLREVPTVWDASRGNGMSA
jgi:alpha-glucosidase